MSLGAFAAWQPVYAEHGVAIFPVHGKKPAVGNYLRIGLPGSGKLVRRFGDEPAFGLAVKRSGLVVLDVDTPDENVLADVLAQYGHTPLVVRSGSRHFHCYYRRSDERRLIRRNPEVKLDLLGNGFVVAPPSMGSDTGRYEIIQGSLSDLANLPKLLHPQEAAGRTTTPVREGTRNDALFKICMLQARHCDDFAALLDVARTENAGYLPPMEDQEVAKVARSAWQYETSGENWCGTGKRVVTTHEEIDELLFSHPDAFLLLMHLRRWHWGRDFVVANAMAKKINWSVKRFAAARRDLEAAGKIEVIQPAGKHRGPGRYRFVRPR